jgi:adenosine/AMP kinase
MVSIMEIKVVKIKMPKESNVILGTSHFIKSIEDLYESLMNSVPNIKFGVGFCESSGECLVRVEGNDEELKEAAAKNVLNLGCGHSFLVFLRNAYPINVLNGIKMVPEVCTIYAATANPLEVIVAETDQGRAILGVVDGLKPKGVEDEKGMKWRKDLLRKIGYKK